MKPFRERNPIILGLAGALVIAAVLVVAFNIDRLPWLRGTSYTANFTESAGLQPGSSVLIAGVDVGTVTSVELEGDHVRVEFEVADGIEFGRATRAKIKIASPLGDKFLGIFPDGRGTMPPGSTIPISRTDPPFTVTSALERTTRTVQEIDTEKLTKALNALSATFRDTPEDVQAALRGLSRLSTVIASRDEQLSRLLERAEGVTEVLAERNAEFVTLLSDANLLLAELDQRNRVITALLVNTRRLSHQLVALVRENQAELEPALQRLQEVTNLLQRKRDALQRILERVAQYAHLFSDTVGTGRWFDTYVQNLVPLPPTVQLPGGG